MGPVFVDWQPDDDDSLVFMGFPLISAFIDNVILTEVRDDIFIIRQDIWNVPTVCDQDRFSGSFPQYMLGCKGYSGGATKKAVYLKSFTHLCGEDKVGCEALIDTKNSASAAAKTYLAGDAGQITVPSDESIWLVNDPKKVCAASAKGCQALGLPEFDQADSPVLDGWNTVYLKNDPDKYSQSLCRGGELDCEQFKADNSYFYFKNPRNKICEYKLETGQTTPLWYKIKDPVYPVDPNDNTPPEICPTETVALGQVIPQYWAGRCPSDQNYCTAYIDPTSQYEPNLFFNGDFSQDLDSTAGPDGWDGNSQQVSLDPYTVYTLAAHGGPTAIDINCGGGTLASPDSSLAGNSFTVDGASDSARLYLNADSPQSCTMTIAGSLTGEAMIRFS